MKVISNKVLKITTTFLAYNKIDQIIQEKHFVGKPFEL